MTLDRFALYEACVQAPDDLARLLAAIHGGSPRVLGEDFCATAALSRRWVERVAGGRAIAVDHDRGVIASVPPSDAVTLLHGDVVAATEPPAGHRADVIHAGNFSIGEWHDRAALLRYLRHVRARLEPGGVFVCDVYGGETAFLIGSTRRTHRGPGGRTVIYTWEQRRADPLTGRVVCAIHFEVPPDEPLRDAFVYDWRLWSVPELRDAMTEAGFAMTEVYARTPDAVDDEGAAYVRPLRDPDELDDSFDVLVAGRVASDTPTSAGGRTCLVSMT